MARSNLHERFSCVCLCIHPPVHTTRNRLFLIVESIITGTDTEGGRLPLLQCREQLSSR